MKIKKLIKKKALPSFCTSNLDVLKIILFYSKKHNLPCLIECTSNQVNQFGGYTNKNPKQFSNIFIDFFWNFSLQNISDMIVNV